MSAEEPRRVRPRADVVAGASEKIAMVNVVDEATRRAIQQWIARNLRRCLRGADHADERT